MACWADGVLSGVDGVCLPAVLLISSCMGRMCGAGVCMMVAVNSDAPTVPTKIGYSTRQ